MLMRSAFDIACYLLRQSKEACIGSITPLKLQKLLYYSQAWSLVFRKKRLFREELEAWVHGPVVPDVYQVFKHYGFSELSNPSSIKLLESDEIRVINEVLETYGVKSAKFLENLSHSEYPWIKARENLHSSQNSRRKISLKNMMSYYSQFVEGDQKNKINPLVLQVKKMRIKRIFHGQFISGVASTLEILPTSSVRSLYAPNDFSSALHDSESTYSDWEKVGEDIQTVFNTIEK
jgi:uncharacterized phage-associated protein